MAESGETVTVKISCVSDLRIHDRKLLFQTHDTILDVKTKIVAVAATELTDDLEHIRLIFLGRILPNNENLASLRSHFRQDDEVPGQPLVTFHAVIRPLSMRTVTVEAPSRLFAAGFSQSWAPLFRTSAPVTQTTATGRARPSSGTSSSTGSSSGLLYNNGSEISNSPVSYGSVGVAAGITPAAAPNPVPPVQQLEQLAFWNDPSVSSYQLTADDTRLVVPNYKTVVLTDPNSRCHVVGFSPDALEQMESLYGPGVGGQVASISHTHTSSPVETPTANTTASEDGQEPMWTISDNTYLRLQFNPGLIFRGLVSWLPSIIRTWFFLSLVLMQQSVQVNEILIPVAIFGIPALSYLYNSGRFYNPLTALRDVVLRYMPHGLPPEIGEEELSLVQQTRTSPVATEGEPSEASGSTAEFAVVDSDDVESEPEPLAPLLRSHTDNQSALEKLKSCVIMFFVSMVPSWHAVWAHEEVRRRRSMSRSIRELRQLRMDSQVDTAQEAL